MVSESRGRFWLASTPSTVSRGQFVVHETGAIEVQVTPEFNPAYELKGISVSAGGETTSKLIPTPYPGPQTVHGLIERENEDPIPVALVAADTVRWGGATQTFRPLWAVTGAHVDRGDQFHGIRVRLPGYGAITSGPVRMQRGGTIEVDHEWVTLHALEGSTWPELERTIVRPLCTLLTLARGVAVRPLAVEVHRDGGTWWPLLAGSRNTASGMDPFVDPLMRDSDLSIEILVKWMDRAHVLGPLPGAYASVLESHLSVEAQALILTTVSEGLHRVLYPKTVRFTVEHAETVREAAVEAVRRVDANEATLSAVKGLLSHVNEVGYAKRLDDLATQADVLVPGIAGKRNRWRNLAYDIRNRYAHQASADWMEDDDLDQVLTTAQSLLWVLRLLLLDQAGFAAELLADRFAGHQSYRLFLTHAAEWQPKVYGQSGFC